MTKARDLANIISGSGSLDVAVIPNLSTSKITSGTFADARLSSSSVTQHVDLSNLSASNLTSGTVPSARLSLGDSDIPNLPTSKITSGTFADARISQSSVTAHVDLSNLNADNLTSGTVASSRLSLSDSDIPNLPATKVTSGSFDTARIPNLSATKITSGTMDGSRISGGTFGSVNGSNLSSLPSSAPSTSQVLSATASASYASVGTYAHLQFDTSSDKTPGGTYSGNLYPTTASGGMPPGYGSYNLGGTWRTMGFGQDKNESVEARSTVYLRIS